MGRQSVKNSRKDNYQDNRTKMFTQAENMISKNSYLISK
uniref:Uncharacterized protein n=2 Tax=Anguilla anguilla TaxID=7936 RepID=A0A0E9TY07_ANGAN